MLVPVVISPVFLGESTFVTLAKDRIQFRMHIFIIRKDFLKSMIVASEISFIGNKQLYVTIDTRAIKSKPRNESTTFIFAALPLLLLLLLLV